MEQDAPARLTVIEDATVANPTASSMLMFLERHLHTAPINVSPAAVQLPFIKILF